MAGCSNSFKVDIAGSNPAGGTTAFEQVKACFSSWPVFVSAHVRQARAPNVRQTSRKPPQRFIAGQRKGPRPLGARPRRGPFSFPVRPLGYRFACPFATRLLARLLGLLPVRSAIPRALGLGYPLATPRRAPLPARTATPRPIAADRRARVQITPSERRTAPHGTARPSALDIPLCARPRPAVKLAPQRVGGGIRDICHQPPRIPRINVARQLRNG